MPTPRIDVHAHYVPPAWREACLKADLGRPLPPWNETDHLAWMHKAHITKSILSITDPGTHLIPGHDDDARKLSRKCNEFAAELKKRRPKQFGFWASLPLPDVEGSLLELEYVLDELDADGVVLLTNHHGTYLGDDKFVPVWEALNRRGVAVLIHPTLPPAHSTMRFDVPSENSLTAMMEFAFDETRAVVSLLTHGILQDYPNLTILLTHAGGVLPPLVERLVQFYKLLSLDIDGATVRDVLRHRVFYDLSLFVLPEQVPGLLGIAGPERMVYGSDYPYVPEALGLELLGRLEGGFEGVVGEGVEQIFHANPERLLSSR